MHVFIHRIASYATEGARSRQRTGSHGQQGSNVQADQLLRLHAHKISQRAVDAQHVSRFVMGNDEVGDRIEYLDPVTLRLFNSSKETRIFERNRSLCGNTFEQLLVFRTKWLLAICQTERTEELSAPAAQPSHHNFRPV